MDILKVINGDWLADIAYPLLAMASALTCVLAFGWHYVPTTPPRRKHPLNLMVGFLSGLLVIPAVLASAATGTSPTLRLDEVRLFLRMSWLCVALGYTYIVVYYVRRFWCAVRKHKVVWDKVDYANSLDL